MGIQRSSSFVLVTCSSAVNTHHHHHLFFGRNTVSWTVPTAHKRTHPAAPQTSSVSRVAVVERLVATQKP